MSRVFLIATIWLLSCGQKPDEGEIEIRDVVTAIPASELDTLSKPDGAFLWRQWVKSDPRLVYLSEKILKHVAKGHVHIDGSYGDIDNNGIPDLVIITGMANEDSLRSTGHVSPRHLLVFLDQKDLSFRNNNAIPCNGCCGENDPYAGHAGDAGQFVIREECRTKKRLRREYKFKYAAAIGDWLLDTIVTETSTRVSGKYRLDTMTKQDFGKVRLKLFSMQSLKKKLR